MVTRARTALPPKAASLPEATSTPPEVIAKPARKPRIKAAERSVPATAASPTVSAATPLAAPAKPRKPRTPKAAPDAAQVHLKASSATKPTLTEEQRQHFVAVAAFYIAERRGFTLGNPVQDWLDAEAEIDRMVASGHFMI